MNDVARASKPIVAELAFGGARAHAVIGFEVVRAMGEAPRATVEARLLAPVEVRQLLGQPAQLAFGAGELQHRFAGIVTAAASIATTTKGTERQWTVRLELASRLAVLAEARSSRIFLDHSVPEIVEAVLVDHGLPASAQRWRLSGAYPKRPLTVQYAESAFDFCRRLLEKEGIAFAVRAEGEDEVVEFDDDSRGAEPIESEPTLAYVPTGGLRQADDAVLRIDEQRRESLGKVSLGDYDFTRPDLDQVVEAKADDGDLCAYEFAYGYVEPEDGRRLARVRLEAERVAARTLVIHATSCRLHEARRVGLAGVPRALDGDYLVTRVRYRHEATTTDDDGPLGRSWLRAATRRARDADRAEPAVLTVEATLVPLDVPYRLPHVTARPSIDGPQTAVVVGPDGAEPETIHTDEHARCKVKFHWDRDEARDDRASAWIRTQQLNASGSMILPRVDWEVLVEFEEGKPDRPVICGRLYNGRHVPPYALPEGKSRSALGSHSSPGGSGRNEIRFEDRAGKEEIAIKAERNQRLGTGNDKSKKTGGDQTDSVGGKRTYQIGGNQTIRVTGGLQDGTSGAESVTIGAARKLTVDAVLGLSAPSLSVTVGGSELEMDGSPLAGIIDLAAAAASEVAQEKAAEQLKKLDEAVNEKLDAAMKTLEPLEQKLGNVQKGLEAAKDGNLAGVADVAREAAGLPKPGEVGDAMKRAAVGRAGQSVERLKGDETVKAYGEEHGLPGLGGEAASAGSDAAKDEGSGAAKGGAAEDGGPSEGGGAEGDGEGGEARPLDPIRKVQDQGFSKASGLDKAVAKGIDRAIEGAAGGLKDALGVGQSGKNFPGPPGGVSGNAAADNACGPGHSVHKVGGSYREAIGGSRITLAVAAVNTNVAATRTQSIGAAHIELVNGTRAESCTDKSESTVGLVVVAGGTEAEKVAGAKSQSVGGVLAVQAGSDAKIAAGGTASFVAALHKVTASSKLTFACGASSVTIDGGGVTIKSPMVNLVAASITLPRTVAQGPGGGAGGAGGAGPAGASGGGGGGGGAAAGGGGGGGGGGVGASGTGQDALKGDKRAAGADQSRRKPPFARKGQPEPDAATRKLASEKNVEPDDGKNAARRAAREEVVDHYHDNHHRKNRYQGRDENGKPLFRKGEPSAREVEGDRKEFDCDHPVNYTPPGEAQKGGLQGPRVEGSSNQEGKPYPHGESPYTTKQQQTQMDEHAKAQKAAGKAILDD
ncbi:MAG: type VI secretion system tip protein VgrG [Deltaproteobacteria bacterium]|nr:type VI secretion system tip protein VgrG [Deltaproteobacteria bacterium]